jgi:hypothetical protein
MREGPAPAQGCADLAAAARRLAHVLPLFADPTPEALAWRAETGIERVDAGDAGVIRDADLCARIDEQARAWHVRAGYAPDLGDYTVYALRIGGYYAAVADYPGGDTVGWGVLLILDPDDLRVLDFDEL